MNGLTTGLPFFLRRFLCRFLPHSDRKLGPDRNELWADGDLSPSTEVCICRRCLRVKRKPT